MRVAVLPQLVRETGYLRVWSIGCSDGCELYSVAMLLHELGHLDRSYLVGTDCRTDAIGAAKAGVYERGTVEGIATWRIGEHFDATDGHYRINPILRGATHWWAENVLAEREPWGIFDLVLCRNMAMYLNPPAANRLWGRLEKTIRPGGVLVLGKAERPIGTKRFILTGPSLYRRSKG